MKWMNEQIERVGDSYAEVDSQVWKRHKEVVVLICLGAEQMKQMKQILRRSRKAYMHFVDQQ
jgi:hypothetical protein